MGKIFTAICVCLLSAFPLTEGVGQSKEPLVFGGSNLYIPANTAITACTANPAQSDESGDPELIDRFCSFPAMTPCVDNDRDGVMFCGKNDRIPIREITEIGPDFSLTYPKPPDSYWWSKPAWQVYPDAVVFRGCYLSDKSPIPRPRCEKILTDGGETCTWVWDQFITTPHYVCAGGGSDLEVDCDDTTPQLKTPGDPANTAPIQSIIYLARDPATTRLAAEAYKVTLNPKAFNPFDTVIVGVKTHPCVSSLEVQVQLNLGGEIPTQLGTHRFTSMSSEQMDSLGIPSSAQYRAPGILYARLPALFSNDITASLPFFVYELNKSEIFEEDTIISLSGVKSVHVELSTFLQKVKRSRERANVGVGATSASLSLLTPLGSTSILFSLDTSVPIYGSGPVIIAVRRADKLAEFLPIGWSARPLRTAHAFARDVLNKPPFKQNKALFTVVADLTILGEREIKAIDSGIIDLHITGTSGVSSHYEIFESAINKRAYTNLWSGKIIMDPTAPRYESASQALTAYYTLVLTHEFGHAFGFLDDEYLVVKEPFAWFIQNMAESMRSNTNCATKRDLTTKFPPPGNFPDPMRAYCSIPGLYRSTLGSIMNNQHEVPKFNVVSCAYLMAKMRGGKASKYFTECEKPEYETVRN